MINKVKRVETLLLLLLAKDPNKTLSLVNYIFRLQLFTDRVS